MFSASERASERAYSKSASGSWFEEPSVWRVCVESIFETCFCRMVVSHSRRLDAVYAWRASELDECLFTSTRLGQVSSACCRQHVTLTVSRSPQISSSPVQSHLEIMVWVHPVETVVRIYDTTRLIGFGTTSRYRRRKTTSNQYHRETMRIRFVMIHLAAQARAVRCTARVFIETTSSVWSAHFDRSSHNSHERFFRSSISFEKILVGISPFEYKRGKQRNLWI